MTQPVGPEPLPPRLAHREPSTHAHTFANCATRPLMLARVGRSAPEAPGPHDLVGATGGTVVWCKPVAWGGTGVWCKPVAWGGPVGRAGCLRGSCLFCGPSGGGGVSEQAEKDGRSEAGQGSRLARGLGCHTAAARLMLDVKEGVCRLMPITSLQHLLKRSRCTQKRVSSSGSCSACTAWAGSLAKRGRPLNTAHLGRWYSAAAWRAGPHPGDGGPCRRCPAY